DRRLVSDWSSDVCSSDLGSLRGTQRGHAWTRPLDLMLDDPTLEGVAGDPEDVGGFYDAASSYECFLTELALCVGQVERVEDDRQDRESGGEGKEGRRGVR